MFAATARYVNDAVLSVFGTPAVLKPGGSDFHVIGVFEPAQERFNSRSASGGPADMAAEGSVWERGDFVLSLLSEDLAASGIEAGETATVGGRTFRIVDILDDFDGMTDVILRPRDQ